MATSLNSGKQSCWLVSLLLLFVSLGACGPGAGTQAVPAADEAPSASATATPEAVAAESTATPSATPAPDSAATATLSPTPQPETLLLWTSEQGPALELVRTVAQEFASDSDLEITVVPKASEQLRISLQTATLLEEPLPDLIWGNQDDLAELLVDDYLQPVGAFVQAEAFLPAVITSATFDGQLWGVPLTAQDTLLLLYNRVLVDQPASTTDALIVRSRELNTPDQAGIVAAWTQGRWLLALLNGFGGSSTTPDGTAPTLNTPEMLNALNLLRELAAAAPAEQTSYTVGRDLFYRGQAAFALDGDWSLTQAAEQLPAEGDRPFELGVAPLPVVAATGRPAAPALNSSYLLLSQDLDEAQLRHARAFANALQAPDVQSRLATELNRLPAVRAVLSAPAITQSELLSAAATHAEAAVGIPPTKAARCALRAMNAELMLFVAENRPPDEAARTMQELAEFCLTQGE